ncbi:DNA adenine methylase [Clostridium sp. SYSU_GA19001]|uniref:DNA adenine methylase n=1 Tax=Clostridium caldaquaticum TaxID=2940653 RepID=UPI0020773D67|nr:DNA adenine methylase [Clostridium caldaquaticum]MCM8710127.1 DNA adenine methylase [Clostridium caldaquaticum]
MNFNLKPFLKWAGGKSQLLDDIIENLPANINLLNKYVEPFVGAGSVFLYFIENNYFDEYIINDINPKLINLYKVIKDNVEALISETLELKTRYLEADIEEREKLYYEIRYSFNEENCDDIKSAAYFIFLNKTCFNGLYRENSKGEFNVPFGKYSNPSFFDEFQLRKISKLLGIRNEVGNYKVKILNKSFNELEPFIDDNTFVYCDPPYRPVTAGGFTSYNKSNFNDESQILLRDFYKVVHKKGAKIMLSNSDPKNLDKNDNFFDDLYSDFYIKRVYAKRSINSVGSARGQITELLITNYKAKKDLELNKINEEVALHADDMNKEINFYIGI